MSLIKKIPFEEAFVSAPVGKLKIKESEYDSAGSICVVDQGQSLVSGMTTRADLKRDDGPYIVFGDHTRIVKFIDFSFVVGADGVRLYKASEKYEPEFLYLFLKSSKLPEDGYGRHSKYLKELFVPEISKEKQRQIAARLKAQLGEVETARQAAKVQLSDARLLRTRMLKAFFAELESTPKKRLGEHAPTTSGSTPSRGNKQYWQPAEIAWVKTGEVAFAPITATEEAISNLALAECSLKLLPSKSVLIAMIGQGKTRGQSAILEIPATTNQNCFAVMPNDTWEPDFLYLWMKSSYQDLRDLSSDRGGNQSALNGALLNALEVPAPSKPEQQKLVARIQTALTEIDVLEQSSKAALADIEKLPARILAKAFENP
ncbi:restriction modification system DNA specificity domain-containing protein [Shewanella baltica OS183]|uniref:restriction endonuclease subunit S n=1 Tax=Shewanella baltica TaxID=62322 RepID=UPI0001E10EAC|nr:restriction endonuclease subunit S [Shewanella baltica]AEG10671.1 restriction modification system DNA specificity domain protein [Shewanella baltica BA175]EHQ15793.1 restriction modification system DNA specificity domain-containing protein [Shewanella baltica OS183]